MLLPPYSSRYGCICSIFSQVTPEWPYVFCTNKRLNSNADKKRHIPTWITAHDRIILAICEHIGAEEAIGVGGSEGVGVNEPAVGEVVVPALEVVKARFAVVIIATVAQRVDVPDEGGICGLFAVSTMHGVVAPRAIGAAAQRDAAGNDDDLWLCADGCTHHSDHLSISLSNFSEFYEYYNTNYITIILHCKSLMFTMA